MGSPDSKNIRTTSELWTKNITQQQQYKFRINLVSQYYQAVYKKRNKIHDYNLRGTQNSLGYYDYCLHYSLYTDKSEFLELMINFVNNICY